MLRILIHFDEATLKAIDRMAPAAKRQRADFIRRAVKDEIFPPNLGSKSNGQWAQRWDGAS
jgi:metal-responsive CopG/Arc/MetJ family transcriptional regulator